MRRFVIVSALLALVAGPTVAKATTGGRAAPTQHAQPLVRAVAAVIAVKAQTIRAGQLLRFPVTGIGTVPLSGVATVRLRLDTVAQQPTSVTIWAADAGRPSHPTVTVPPGHHVVDHVVTPAADGMLRLVSNQAAKVAVTVTGLTQLPPVSARGIDWSHFNTAPLTSRGALPARQILINANRYALLHWWPEQGPHLLAELSNRAHAKDDPVRQLAMEAYSLAASLGSGAFATIDLDGTHTNVGAITWRTEQRAEAAAVVATILARLAQSHVTTTPNGWGDSWQSALWASLAERAAMMQWSALGTATRSQIARMAELEADCILRRNVRYLRDAHGRLLTAGNSGAEEDAWNSLAVTTAAAMLPTHPHRAAWEHKATALLLAAWARPSDLTSRTVVNGAPLSSWLHGSNVQPNGGLINHGRVAPDYSTTTYMNIDSALTDALVGVPAPVAATRGISVVYGALSRTRYDAPPFRHPGGTPYGRYTSAIYYPEGCDWGTGQQTPYALADTQAWAFRLDGRATAPVTTMQRLHLQAQLRMQGRFSDGHTYASSREYNYVGREAHVAQLAAETYLTLFVHDRRIYRATNRSTWSAAYATEYDAPAATSEVPMLYERSLQSR